MERYKKHFKEETPGGPTTTHFFYADHGWVEGETYPSLNASIAPTTAKVREINNKTDEDLVLVYTYQENIGKGFVHWVSSALSKMIQPKIFKNQPVTYMNLKAQIKEFPKRMRHLMFTVGE